MSLARGVRCGEAAVGDSSGKARAAGTAVMVAVGAVQRRGSGGEDRPRRGDGWASMWEARGEDMPTRRLLLHGTIVTGYHC